MTQAGALAEDGGVDAEAMTPEDSWMGGGECSSALTTAVFGLASAPPTLHALSAVPALRALPALPALPATDRVEPW